jgi:threonine/homoserine/homoserine lactone efflux protein
MLMDFLPSLPVFAAFSLAAFVLMVTPGPDMTLQIAKTLAHGRSIGFCAVLGASVGLLIHTVFAAVGLSALLATSATAFEAVKIAGALYLLWLAIDAIRNGSALNVDQSSITGDVKPGAIFAQAFLINLLNPKVILFFVTFLPQFVDASDPHAGGKLFVLGVWQILIGLPVAGAIVWSAGAISAALKRRPRIMRAIDYIFAALFGGFALKLLSARALS